ncbi:MAG TPA: cell division ATP-binding protein FtsE, partial [Arthrobacter sp.]|nr:cell division ATP-binding protein FtsE [Arthrobacter sp.]
AKSLYTSMIPVVGQSRRLKDASDWEELPPASPEGHGDGAGEEQR